MYGTSSGRRARSVSTYASLLSLLYLLLLLDSTGADCPMPDTSFKNGRIIYQSINDFNLTLAPENYVLRFRCYVNYVRIGAVVVACENGKWSPALPYCISQKCPKPPPIENGTYTVGNRRSIGSLAHYRCNLGFEIANANVTSLVCTLQKGVLLWSGEVPSCVETTTCSDPGIPLQGLREGDCCFKGNVVQYSCKSRYELVGERHITCLAQGIWSADRPRCRPLTGHCPDPPDIANGTVKGNSIADYFIPYEEAEVVCSPGFAFYGISEFVMCMESLEWDVEFGECIETFCPPPEAPANGIILELESTNRTEFPYKFEMSYMCHSGFRLIGDSYRSCDKGNWTGDEPRCDAIKCPNPGHPQNGYRYGSDFSIGQKVIFSCSQGFNLIGSIERYCLQNGQWSGELTRCNLESNYCPNPGVPINGMKEGSSYNEGDIVKFRCHPGFSLVGSVERKCLPDGNWSGKEVKCLGDYDFDDASAVGTILKVAINEKAEEQAAELENFENALAIVGNVLSNGTVRAIQTKRILNLNDPARLILYFVFDVSGSVRERNFNISINFAKALVTKIGISQNGARAGALTFSSKAKEEFNPVEHATTEDVLKALDKIKFTSGGTATSSVLRLIRKEAIPLTREYVGRKGVKYVIFILTDGKANTGGDPVEEAKLLKESYDAEIYCIGITGSIKKNTLYKIASKPTEEHVFVLNHYKTLEWLIQEITNGTIDYSQCGLGLDEVGRSKQRSRIIGGIQVVEPWPWMAALYITDKKLDEAELKCGGSIIGQKWILTAAHCLFKDDETIPRDVSQVIIKLGLTDVKNSTHLQEFEAARFFIHENYNFNNFDNDIALIQLNGIIEYNAYVRPICLPPEAMSGDSTLYKVDENAFATGWGHAGVVPMGEKVVGQSSRYLKELRLPLQSRDRCLQSVLDSGGINNMFTDKMLCAGTGDGTGDTCAGDSGGPLMQSQLNEARNIFWTQIGLVSWGIGCSQINTYGFYTHVHRELDWIKNILNSGGE